MSAEKTAGLSSRSFRTVIRCRGARVLFVWTVRTRGLGRPTARGCHPCAESREYCRKQRRFIRTAADPLCRHLPSFRELFPTILLTRSPGLTRADARTRCTRVRQRDSAVSVRYFSETVVRRRRGRRTTIEWSNVSPYA